MQELKSLLLWIKDETIKNPEEKISFELYTKDNNVCFNLDTNSDNLNNYLNNSFQQKINNSNILKTWYNNQINAYKEISKDENLCINMDTICLLSKQEAEKIVEKRMIKQKMNKK